MQQSGRVLDLAGLQLAVIVAPGHAVARRSRAELPGRALGHDPALLDDGHAIAQRLRLVEVVRGEQDRLAQVLQRADALPCVTPGGGIEARGRLVEEDQHGRVSAEQGESGPRTQRVGGKRPGPTEPRRAGRQGTARSPRPRAGGAATTIGPTKNTAAKADKLVALFLSRDPRARPMNAATVRYNDAPTTVRSTPGSAREIAEAPGRLDSCRDEEFGHGGQEGHREHQPRQHDQLRPEHRPPRWHHGQRRANHPGPVFAAEHQHAERTDHQLGDQDAEQADRHRVGGRMRRRDPVRFPAREHGAHPDDQQDRDQHAGPGRAQRTQLHPLRADAPPWVTGPAIADPAWPAPEPAASVAFIVPLRRDTQRCPV